MFVSKAGKSIGVQPSDSAAVIHQRAELHFAAWRGYWAVVVVSTIAFTDCYILFYDKEAFEEALKKAPPGFERGPQNTLFAEILYDDEAWR